MLSMTVKLGSLVQKKKIRREGVGWLQWGRGEKEEKEKKRKKKRASLGGVVLGWGGQNRIQAQAHIQRDQ